MTIKPASPAPPPPPVPLKEDQAPSEQIPWVPIVTVLIFAFGFIICGLSQPALLVSVFCLVWLIFLSQWIKKIKDRQTETVLIQTMSLQALQEILEQIKKQNS